MMAEKCGWAKKNQENAFLTRREFLKTSGGVAVGAIFATIPIRPKPAPRILLPSVDADAIKLALSISINDAMFQIVEAELQATGFALEANYEKVKFSDAQSGLVGIVLAHSLSPSHRMGADVALTVDINSVRLTSIHLLIGWSLVSLSNCTSVLFDYRDELFYPSEDTRHPSLPITEPNRPRIEKHWAFPRSNSPPVLPLDRTKVGWPQHAENPASGYWHYGGCTRAEWHVDRGESVYRCAEIGETHALYPDKLVILPFSS